MGRAMNNLDIERLAEQLARKHRIPASDIIHLEVVMDPFMMKKMKDEANYVPYCLVRTECGRVRRRVYGFECPTCGNKMNYDMTHYDGNKNVQYIGTPAAPDQALAGFPPMPGEWWRLRGCSPAKVAQRRAQHADITAWNAQVDARKTVKKGRKP